MFETFDSHSRAAAGAAAATPLRRPTVLDMIARQVARTPHARALDHAGISMSYAELYARSAGVASRLARRGIGRGDIVGFLGGRSIETLIGLLGILRAGAAYLPLDPAHPTERLSFIARDAAMRALVAPERATPGIERVLPGVPLEPADPGIPPEGSWTAPPISPSDAAYVIYTSGSTGKPKGVAVHHRGLANFVASMQRVPGISPADVMAAVTTISFDIAGLEMWLPLAAGARITIVPLETARDGVRLAAFLESQGVTVLQATPATWRMLLDSGWAGKPDLTALCGGEALTRSLADRLLPRCRALWNLYGPTETTIWSTVHRVEPGTGPVPIGQPIDNTSVRVLGPDLRPVPAGSEGELFIGGDGVALGYLNRPELTTARFVPDPFSAERGARLYRTGDRVRQRADGALLYLGRLDDQLKIRGFRVEPGEVESALMEDEAVSAAAVVAPPGGEPARLVAYVVPRPGRTVVERDVRARLRARLPEYMVPSRVLLLDALPLTPSGKVDRRALPAPTGLDEDREYVAPRNAVESRLARLWAKVLGMPRVSVTADFDALGGDSLQAVQLFAAIEREFGTDLPVATLVDTPTVERLAARLGAPEAACWTPLVPVRAGGSPRLFFVHGGGGTTLFLRGLATPLPPRLSLYGLQSEGQAGRRMTRCRVEEMSELYLEAIRTVQPSGPYLLAGYCFGGLVAFEMARRLRAAGHSVALLALINARNQNPLRCEGVATGGSEQAGAGGRGTLGSGPSGNPRVGLSRRLVAVLARGRPLRSAREALAWRIDALRADPRLRQRFGEFAHLALHLGGRLPPSWRPHYIAAMTSRAERLYRPAFYDGKLTLLNGTGLFADPLAGWAGLAAEIEGHEIGPAQRLRRELIAPPLARELGERLGSAIAKTLAPPAPNPLAPSTSPKR